MLLCFFFFFQAEDGIRDLTVTGVQTCALPIYAMSGLTSQPNLGSLVEALRHGPRDPGIDPAKLRLLSSYWEQVRRLYAAFERDRKSTRLNSSHSQKSYAGFCLKKKNHASNYA